MKGKLIAGLTALALTGACAQEIPIANKSMTTSEKLIASQHIIMPEDVSVTQMPKPAKEESVWQQYLDEINPSVVCIRDKAMYEAKGIGDFSLKEKKVAWIQKGHGSGTIFKEVEHEGRREYLILTNYHVAYSKKIIGGARMLKQELFLVENEEDSFTDDDIALEKIANSPDNDMTILRTIGAPELPVAKMKMGLPKELNGDDRLFTSGFPLAENKIATEGQISSTTFYEAIVVPVPLEVYSANISIDSGQSGSPVAIPVKENGKTVFYCIGLVYAKASSTDTIRLITPIDKAKKLFETMKDVPSKRPKLSAPITKDLMDELDQVYIINGKGLEIKCSEDSCNMNMYLMAGTNPVMREYVQTNFSLKDGLANVKNISYIKDGQETHMRNGNEEDNVLFSALLNYCGLQEKSSDLWEQLERTTAETRKVKYMERVLGEDARTMKFDIRAFFYELYQNNEIPEFYLR